MAPRIDDVMRLCCDISADFVVTFQQSAKGVIIALPCVLLGGVLLGPLGLAIGGAVGGLLGWAATAGQFKPLPQVLRELTPSQQRKLYSDVMAVLGNLDWTDGVQLVAKVMDNTSLQQQVMAVVLNYVAKDLKRKARQEK